MISVLLAVVFFVGATAGYWLIFYGVTLTSLIWLTVATWQSLDLPHHQARRRPVHLIVPLAGGLLSSLWPLSGPLTWALLLVGTNGTAQRVASLAPALVIVGASALCIGLLGPPITRTLGSGARTENLRALHTYLIETAPEQELLSAARGYHRSIETHDALATLQAYSRATDEVVDDPASIAQAIRDAAPRRRERRHKERGQYWSAWASDEDQLALRGKHFRMTGTSKQSVARTITNTLQPAITVPIGVTAIGFVCGEWTWAAIALLLTAGLPVALVLTLRATHVLDSMRLPRRSSRLILMTIMITMELAVIAAYQALDAPTLLIHAQVALLTGLVAVALLTTLLRVSVHCAAISVMVVTLTGVGSPEYATLLLLVPVVGWSRLAVREHTRWQVIIGAAAPILPTALALALLG